MAISDEQLKFWATKNPAQEYETIIFNHPSFKAPIRLVANCFSEQIFDGHVFTPVAMKVKRPDMGKEPVSEVTLQFSRIQIGDNLKEILKGFSTAGWMKPIEVIYQLYSELNKNTSINKFSLYVSNISMNSKSVQVKARDDNEMILDISTIYTLEEYPGLETV